MFPITLYRMNKKQLKKLFKILIKTNQYGLRKTEKSVFGKSLMLK